MSFRENLKNELIYQDIKVKELAEKTQISIGTLNHYLAEKSTEPTVQNAVKIAKVLNVTVEYLVTGELSRYHNSDEHFMLCRKYYSIIEKIDKLQDKSQEVLINLISTMK